MDEDWAVSMSFPLGHRRELVSGTGTLKGLCKDRLVEPLLRVLLLHVRCGHSLHGSVVRAVMAGLADFRHVDTTETHRAGPGFGHRTARCVPGAGRPVSGCGVWKALRRVR